MLTDPRTCFELRKCCSCLEPRDEIEETEEEDIGHPHGRTAAPHDDISQKAKMAEEHQIQTVSDQH